MTSDDEPDALETLLARHRAEAEAAGITLGKLLSIRYPWTHDCSRDCDLAGGSAEAPGALFSDYFTLAGEYTAGIPGSHTGAQLAKLLSGQPPHKDQP